MRGLSETLKQYLAEKTVWISKGNIERVTFYSKAKVPYMADTVARTLRTLESQAIIAQRPAGKSIEYRYLPEIHRSAYIPYSERPDDKKDIIFKI